MIGNYDLVKAICNFGADVLIKDNDGDDAIKYAIAYGRYNITEMIFYRQLSGSLGNDLRQIASDIFEKRKEAMDIDAFKATEEEKPKTASTTQGTIFLFRYD